MRAPDRPTTVAVPSRSKAAQRRRRLHRGVDRWDFDRRHLVLPTRRIATLTLTVADGDYEAAYGKVRQFWHDVRHAWLGSVYFCFLELQRRGAVHYHAVWVNPPHVKHVNLLAWVDHHWGLGRTQVRFSGSHGGIERAVDYARNYAKKMGRKSYQQAYDNVPSQLRTFMSQRLEFTPKEIDEHLDGDVYAYHSPRAVPEAHRPGHTTFYDEYLEYRGRRQHVIPPGGYCTLVRRRPKRGPPEERPMCLAGVLSSYPYGAGSCPATVLGGPCILGLQLEQGQVVDVFADRARRWAEHAPLSVSSRRSGLPVDELLSDDLVVVSCFSCTAALLIRPEDLAPPASQLHGGKRRSGLRDRSWIRD